MYLLFEEPSAYSEKYNSLQLAGTTAVIQLLECEPIYVQVFWAYTSHSAAPVVQLVEPPVTESLRTNV